MIMFFQDFVPYVVRVAKLLLTKTESVHPMYVLITCFHESWIFYLYLDVFSRKSCCQTKRQISWEKIRFRRFRIRENIWWTRYRSLKEGEPQLTMTSIFSLEDLAPFFAAICESVTKQQTKGQSRRKPLRSFTRSVNLKMSFWCLQFKKKKSALASKKRSNKKRSVRESK